MRLWLKITIAIVCSLMALVGIGLFYLTGPDREVAKNPFMSAISEQTNEWDQRVKLIPDPLVRGASLKEVEAQLSSAGFQMNEGEVLRTGWMPRETKDPADRNLRRNNEIVFVRNHGNFVCDLDYIVFLTFDQSNSLISAEGLTRGLACL